MDKEVQDARPGVTDARSKLVFRGAPHPDLDVERALNLLSVVEAFVQDDVSYTKVAPGDPVALDECVGAAEQSLCRRIQEWDFTDRNPDGQRMVATLMQLGVVRSALKDTLLARRQEAVSAVAQVLQGFRSFGSLSELLRGAPPEIHRLGLRRVLLSRVEDRQWIAESGSVVDDPGLAHDMVRVGQQNPGSLTGAMIESDMVRRRVPLLVRDPQDNPRVHPELKELVQTSAYVAAPVLARGSVVGLVHADENIETRSVGFYDRDVLGMFAEGLGFAIERVMFYERLQGIRNRLNDHTRAVHDLIDEFVDADVEFIAPECDPPQPRRDHPARERPVIEPDTGGNACALTRRENEVLHRMALGETNLQIATKLFVSVGTVKSHVKRILRKLDASNRAAAVSYYHLMMRDSATTR